ncbi:hypothetical protein ACQPXB_21695 [Amycolatopsis sp. CA-161197]|uniref:hypothetical protein n=1 Tax=Amycolatopsis sp. CA-161197 TaxID=3239922 RepID=UPI003D8CB695
MKGSLRLEGHVAVFVCTAPSEDHAPVQALPRVWDGRGLGLPERDVAGFTAALGEIMKTPLFWRSYRGAGRGAARTWAEPHTDPEDGFVYVSGPCGDASDLVGYRPVNTFTIALADVRGLRIRLAAHLHARLVGA